MSAATTLGSRLTATVGRELVVGVTGLALVGFLIAHLSGNLLIFAGPGPFNAYAHKLEDLGALLWVARIGLASMFVLHIAGAISLSIKNRGARAVGYERQRHAGSKSIATRMMLNSGVLIFAFLLLHLADFTLRAHAGAGAMVGGEDLGLYGLVWNKFSNPLWATVYIAAVFVVGLHLSHALSSVFVTLGVLNSEATPRADRAARVVGTLIALGFASIPVYVQAMNYWRGGGA